MARGMAAAEKALNEASSGQGNNGKLLYFGLKDNETKIIRFLDDDLLTCSFYDFIIDKDGKPQTFIEPSSLKTESGDPDPGFPASQDPVRRFGARQREYGTNNLIEPVPSRKTIGIAVVQEEAPRNVDGKMKMGYRDKIEAIDVDSKSYPAREFVIVKQAYKNFWVQVVGYFHEYGTICDRPYKITRRGTKDVSYQIIPLAADAEFDYKAFQASYGYSEKRASDDPDRFLYCPADLDEWAEDFASEKRARHFLVGDDGSDTKPAAATATNGASSDGAGEFHKDTTHNPEGGADEAQAQAAPPPASRDFDALRERLEGHKKK